MKPEYKPREEYKKREEKQYAPIVNRQEPKVISYHQPPRQEIR